MPFIGKAKARGTRITPGLEGAISNRHFHQAPSMPGGSFNPKSISGLALWLDANTSVYNDAGTTLATNGQTVQQWNDQSGVGGNASQATSGLRPSWQATGGSNSKASVRFTAASSTVLGGTLALTKGNGGSIFLVGRISTTPASHTYFDSSDTTGTNRGMMLFEESGSMKLRVASGGAAFTNSSQSYMILSGIHTPTTRTVFLNGASQNTEATSVDYVNSLVNYRVGELFGDIYPIEGDVCEILLYNRNLTTAEQRYVEINLGKKHGITVS